MKEEDYQEGFEEYVSGGVREESAKSYRCAVDLYYKAVCQLIDYLLCQKPPIRDGWHDLVSVSIFEWFLTLEIPRNSMGDF